MKTHKRKRTHTLALCTWREAENSHTLAYALMASFYLRKRTIDRHTRNDGMFLYDAASTDQACT